MTKIISWVMLNGASLLGILQAVIKAIKELVTGIVNLLSLFMTDEAAEASVLTLRSWLNKVDGWIENIKTLLL